MSARAMRLADGAEAIRGDLPASATRIVDVPAESGDALGTGVRRFSALLNVRDRLLHSLATVPDWALTIGGDCGVSLGAVEHAMRRTGGDLAVVWLDAHPDLNVPDDSPSGAFTGMVLRALCGDGELLPDAAHRLHPDRLVLGGIRDVDPAESAFIDEKQISRVGAEQLDHPGLLLDAVRATGAGSVYVHIDLDVLDPAVITGLANPLPFGLSLEQLTGAVAALRAEFPLAGATIAGFSPASPLDAEGDLPTILRVIGALTR
ncbi:arginase family protein [Microterricola pindariensis]|uniref:Arginase n=1 Tax=Microterricola pindariensis TaxID=478010 RepID=A0ABX5B004_9MICO|nr:arginase family protein [Microterricola pindariensis]PPL20114.1 arginase [Microterricola pindariensis]